MWTWPQIWKLFRCFLGAELAWLIMYPLKLTIYVENICLVSWNLKLAAPELQSISDNTKKKLLSLTQFQLDQLKVSTILLVIASSNV